MKPLRWSVLGAGLFIAFSGILASDLATTLIGAAVWIAGEYIDPPPVKEDRHV